MWALRFHKILLVFCPISLEPLDYGCGREAERVWVIAEQVTGVSFLADAVGLPRLTCIPKCQRPCEFVFMCLAMFHSIYSLFEMLGFHSSSQLNCCGEILQMFLIRGVSRRAEGICSFTGVSQVHEILVPSARVFSVPLFIGKFLNTKVVFEATVRQYNFASILSVLGKFVNCRILGSG